MNSVGQRERRLSISFRSRLASKCSCFCFGWKLLSREFLLWLIRQRYQWGEEEIATHEAEMLAVLTSAGGSDSVFKEVL
jgi:hypothetical protein